MALTDRGRRRLLSYAAADVNCPVLFLDSTYCKGPSTPVAVLPTVSILSKYLAWWGGVGWGGGGERGVERFCVTCVDKWLYEVHVMAAMLACQPRVSVIRQAEHQFGPPRRAFRRGAK